MNFRELRLLLIGPASLREPGVQR